MKKPLLALALSLAVLVSLIPAAEAHGIMGSVDTTCTISVGYSHSAAILPDGSLWTWGRNQGGQLGDGTTTDRKVPVKVMENVVSVVAGDWDTTALQADGSLWLWGRVSGRVPRLEDLYAENSTPVKIMEDVVSFSAGGYYTVAIKSDGSLWGYGKNDVGQLGDSTIIERRAPVKIMEDVVAVSAGTAHTAAIKSDGTLWTWGMNKYAQLGNRSTKNTSTPVKVMEDMVAVSAAEYHTAAIKSDGTLWVWGDNNTLGLGSWRDMPTDDNSPATKVMEDVVAVSAGRYDTAVIKSDGSLWMWGYHTGIKGREISDIPVQVMEDVAAVSTYNRHVLALKADGTLLVWGDNEYGELGDDTHRNRETPVEVLISQVQLPVDRRPAPEPPAEWVTVVADHDSMVTPPAILTKEGHSFVGWYKDAALTQPWNFAQDKAAGEVTLYSKWTPLPTTGQTVSAAPNASKVLVDGKPVDFEAYTIDGNNYFKLRDLAHVLDATARSFGVGWNEAHQAITLTTNARYNAVGGELATGGGKPQTVTAATSTIYLDGQVILLPAYVMDGNHFFKLRDLGVALNFGVEWDGAAGTIGIRSDSSYSADQ